MSIWIPALHAGTTKSRGLPALTEIHRRGSFKERTKFEECENLNLVISFVVNEITSTRSRGKTLMACRGTLGVNK